MVAAAGPIIKVLLSDKLAEGCMHKHRGVLYKSTKKKFD